jgi:DNA-binding SARP family transcriptional activator
MVRYGDSAVAIPPGKQRALLAALLVNANQMVSWDDLTETLWGTQPPPSARVTLQNYVVRLRKALREVGDSRISTQPRGYTIRADRGELDVSQFGALLSEAKDAARGGSWQLAADRASAALTLWRGEPLADVDSETLTLWHLPRLAELRVQALETRIEADLHLGRHRDVIAELRLLVDAHPLREHLHGQLMLALWHGGRQAEALAAYAAVRRVIVEELGAEPGAELRTLHQRILTTESPPGSATACAPLATASRAAESQAD